MARPQAFDIPEHGCCSFGQEAKHADCDNKQVSMPRLRHEAWIADLVAKCVPKPDNGDRRAQEEFLARIMRAVSSSGLIDEVGPGIYQSNELTVTIADQGFAACFMLISGNMIGPHLEFDGGVPPREWLAGSDFATRWCLATCSWRERDHNV